jgi:ribosomal-protein-alanine N-acetyltransferase
MIYTIILRQYRLVMKMIELETVRLYMREILIDDAELMFNLNVNDEVVKYTGDVAFGSLEEVRSFINSYDQYQIHKTGRLQVFLKKSQKYLGFCGLKTHSDKSVDLGFRFLQEEWGNGYAYEASVACINYGFSNLKLTEIVANFMPDNKASENLLLKLGFNPFATEVEDGIFWNTYKLLKPLE